MAGNGKLTIKAVKELTRDPARLALLSDRDVYEMGKAIESRKGGNAIKWALYAAHDLVMALQTEARAALDWRMANPSADWDVKRDYMLRFVVQRSPSGRDVRIFIVGNRTFTECTRGMAALLGRSVKDSGGFYWIGGLTPYYAPSDIADAIRWLLGLRPSVESDNSEYRAVTDIIDCTLI